MLGIDQNIITASSSEMDCFSILLTLVLLKIQLFRRLYESLFVSSFSGKMHLAHYITGVVFYFMVNITVLAEIPYTHSKGNHGFFLSKPNQLHKIKLQHKNALSNKNVRMRTYFFISKSSFLRKTCFRIIH